MLGYLPAEQVDADETFARSLITTTVRELGGIDLLANIAGGRQQFVENLLDLTSESFEKTFRINVNSLFWVIQEALPHVPYSPSPILVDYASTKATINTMSKSLAQQLAPHGIRVNVVAPGPI